MPLNKIHHKSFNVMKSYQSIIFAFVTCLSLGFADNIFETKALDNSLLGSWVAIRDYKTLPLNIYANGTFDYGQPHLTGTWSLNNNIFTQSINGCVIQHEVIWQGDYGFHLKCTSSTCNWYKSYTILFYKKVVTKPSDNSPGIGLIEQSEKANEILSGPSNPSEPKKNSNPSWKLCPSCLGQGHIYSGGISEDSWHVCYGCGGLRIVYY
jgi:hypothetical protein